MLTMTTRECIQLAAARAGTNPEALRCVEEAKRHFEDGHFCYALRDCSASLRHSSGATEDFHHVDAQRSYAFGHPTSGNL